MDTRHTLFAVLGIGHFAAAVRVQLRRCGLSVETGFDIETPEYRHVLLACSDYQCKSSFADANRRAVRARSPILFSWITHGRVEIGPLVVPLESPCFECQATRIWDFSLKNGLCRAVYPAPRATLNPDTRLRAVARFGAFLVVRELRAIQPGAWNARLVGVVAKFDPACIHPRLARLTRMPDCPVCGSGPGANRGASKDADARHRAGGRAFPSPEVRI